MGVCPKLWRSGTVWGVSVFWPFAPYRRRVKIWWHSRLRFPVLNWETDLGFFWVTIYKTRPSPISMTLCYVLKGDAHLKKSNEIYWVWQNNASAEVPWICIYSGQQEAASLVLTLIFSKKKQTTWCYGGPVAWTLQLVCSKSHTSALNTVLFTVRSMPKFGVLFMLSERSKNDGCETMWNDGHFTADLVGSYLTNFPTCDMAAGDKDDVATVNVAALFRCNFHMFLH